MHSISSRISASLWTALMKHVPNLNSELRQKIEIIPNLWQYYIYTIEWRGLLNFKWGGGVTICGTLKLKSCRSFSNLCTIYMYIWKTLVTLNVSDNFHTIKRQGKQTVGKNIEFLFNKLKRKFFNLPRK